MTHPKPLSEAELKEMEERAARATPGPWRWFKQMFGWKALEAVGRVDQRTGEQLYVLFCRNDGVAGMREPDAELIASARTDVPILLAEVRRLRGVLDWYAKAGPMDMAQDCDFANQGGYTVMKGGKRAREALGEK